MSRQTQASLARDARILKAYQSMEDKGRGSRLTLAERFGCSASYISQVLKRARDASAPQQTTQGTSPC